VKERVILDLSKLATQATGTSSPTWWGTLAFMLIEGTGFALGVVIYLYLMSLAPEWPIRAPLPDLGPGVLVTGLFVASLVPNLFLAHWAKDKKKTKVRVGLLVLTTLSLVLLAIRAFEFRAMNVSWDTNAYGSVVWLLLGLHTTHILTEVIETAVLTWLMFTRHGKNARRFADVGDNAMYWNFVVATWIPIYFCIYWIPRL